MEQITIKEKEKILPLNKKIQIKGHKIWSCTKAKFPSWSNGFKKLKEKLKEVIPNEEVQQKENKKEIEDITKKIERKENIVSLMKQSGEFESGVGKYRLEEVRKEISKLRVKRIKRERKGLGVFSLAKLTLNQIIINGKNKVNKYQTQMEEAKLKEELLSNYNKIVENKKKILELENNSKEIKNKEDAILKENPNLNSYFDELTNVSNAKTTFNAKIKNVEKEEIEKIKKTSNYKKAIATLSLAAGITLSSALLSGDSSDKSSTSIEKNEEFIDLSVEDTIKEEKPQELNLGGYVKLKEGSKIYESSELSGKVGLIGMNGYDSEQLFKINAITCIDSNNKITLFSLIQKDENSKKQIMEQYKNYVKENDITILNIHITPCNEYGIEDDKEMDLGGWTNNEKSGISTVSIETILNNTQKALQSKKVF